MGHHYGSTFGYGLLLLDDNNRESDISGMLVPKGFTTELIGDMVLGEDCGIFYSVEDVVITVNMASKEYFGEYVTEYTDFKVNGIDAKLREWLEKFQEQNELVGKIGVFEVGSFG